MDALAIKERLHEYIETADTEHLAAMYLLLEKEISPSRNYSDEMLRMLYKRVEDDLNGLSSSYSIEQAFASVRSARK